MRFTSAFHVVDDVLIAHVEERARGQNGAPMRHQTLIASIVAAEFAEIVGVVLLRREPVNCKRS